MRSVECGMRDLEVSTVLNQGTDPQSQIRNAESSELRQAFHQMLGETLFRMAIKQMRRSVGSGGLFSQGATSEIIFGMFDEHVAELMAKTQPRAFSERYFEQFERMRSRGGEPLGRPPTVPTATHERDAA